MVKIANLLGFMAVFLLSCKKEQVETIAPPQFNISVTAVSAAEGESGNSSGTVEEKYTVNEVYTYCQYRDDGLRLLIQFDSPGKVPDDQTAYFLAVVPGAEEGKSVTIDQDNETTQAMVFIRPKSEPAPKTTDTPINYTTRQSHGTFTNKRPPSSCIFAFTKAQKGGETKGTLECSDMAQFDEISNAELIPLGEILDLSGEWQCDGYIE